jgi:succinate dehydrogenase/fumarate reductase flavoprotein subunit
VDLLVIGGGIAGLTAAARVVRGGGSAVVVECAPELGGSGRYAGFLHTAASVAALERSDPLADRALQEQLVLGYAEAMAWVEELGVDCGPEVPVIRGTRGRHIDTNAYIAACAAIVEGAHRSSILLEAQTARLLMADGAVVGAVVSTRDGRELEIHARNTLLATGGFQGDPSLVADHIHPHGPMMPLRSSPTSRGAGLRLGTAAGADVRAQGAMFYGHLVPYGVALGDPSSFADLSQYYSEHGLLFNLRGERFVDETDGDHVNAVCVLEQPEARALLVIDSRVREQWMLPPFVAGMAPSPDRFQLALRRGGRAAVAHDVDEFAYLPDDWGYPGAIIRDGIEAFNAAALAGEGLQPAREFDAEPMVDPPYYAMDVTAAITFTYAGLLIDASARALDAEGHAIPGLLSAGADAGGTFARGYAGGLANAVVFGIRAARTATGEDAHARMS